jgi:hypothetical protein
VVRAVICRVTSRGCRVRRGPSSIQPSCTSASGVCDEASLDAVMGFGICLEPPLMQAAER